MNNVKFTVTGKNKVQLTNVDACWSQISLVIRKSKVVCINGDTESSRWKIGDCIAMEVNEYVYIWVLLYVVVQMVDSEVWVIG